MNQEHCQDILNVTFPNSWFVDFMEINTNCIPTLLNKFKKEVSNQRYYIKKNVENNIERIGNVHEYIENMKSNLEMRIYIAMFKELFFGNFVDFLLILKSEGKILHITIKMDKSNLKIGMNQEERLRSFEYLTQTIQDYFQELLEIQKIEQ